MLFHDMLLQGASERFIVEAGSIASGDTIATTTGSNWNGSENIAYVGFGSESTAGSRSFSSFTFSGSTGTLSTGSQDNLNSENKTWGMGLRNTTTNTSYTLNVNTTGTIADHIGYVRLIGGINGRAVTVVSSTNVSHPTYPYTHNLTVQKNDIIVLGIARRWYPSEITSTASNMTLRHQILSDFKGTEIFTAQASSSGTFTTQIYADVYQQWGHTIAVFRLG